MKIIKNIGKNNKEPFITPKGVQDIIPIKRIWKDGIFLVGKNKYSKSYKFTDVNYATASRIDKEEIFLKYSELLNSFDSQTSIKITISNRKINKKDFNSKILIKYNKDDLDKYREEYNDMLKDKINDSNGIN